MSDKNFSFINEKNNHDEIACDICLRSKRLTRGVLFFTNYKMVRSKKVTTSLYLSSASRHLHEMKTFLKLFTYHKNNIFSW